MPQDPAPSRAWTPRWSLAGLSLVHALVFAWAASVLPWQRWTMFAVTTAVLALLHAVTAILALARMGTRARAWRVTSCYALAYLALHTFTAVRSGLYIAALYGGLGRGVAAGLAAVWCVLVLFTLPLALFETETITWTPQFMGALAWSVLALTLGGSSLLYLLIQRGAATSVTSLLYLVPPTTALMAWVLFGESITLATVIGTALTAVGVSLVVRPAKPRAA